MLYDVIGNYCYCPDDVCPKVFMAGELTWVFSDSTESCIITILTFNDHLMTFLSHTFLSDYN